MSSLRDYSPRVAVCYNHGIPSGLKTDSPCTILTHSREATMFLHVTKVEYLEDYKLQLKFSNGEEGIVDLEQELYGEVFEPLRDKSLFKQVFLTNRTIEWPNGADFAPEFLLETAKILVSTE
jgi:hypothetical protein